MVKRAFVYGAVILLTANIFNRVLGFVYQYLIMTHIGAEAYGLFNMVFPVYMMALVLTTAGIPLALTKLISEEISQNRPHQAKAIFHFVLCLLTITGAFVSILLYFCAPFFAHRLFPDVRVLNVFLICTPAIFIVSIASAFRGYFQGLQNMVPTAISQIIEQIVRISIGFTLAIHFLPQGISWAAAGLAIGMLAGELIGLIVIVLQYQFKKEDPDNRQSETTIHYRQIAKRLWLLSSPLTIGRLLSTGLSALDAVVIPFCLQNAGYNAREATTLYGQLGGAGFTLLTFPSVFTMALATSLVPSISEAVSQRRMEKVRSNSLEALRLTIVLSIPWLLILFYFAEPLTALFQSVNIAPVLRILAFGGIFAYILQTTNGILHGLGKMHLPVIHSMIAACIRIPLLVYLTKLPQVGLLGCAWSYVIGFFVLAILNLTAIVRLTGLPIDLKTLILQPGSAGLASLIIFKLFTPFAALFPFGTLFLILLGFAVYLALLFFNGGLRRKDLYRLPWIGKFIPF